MLSRRKVKQQAVKMQQDVRRMVLDGTLSSSEMLPSVRELAGRYGISHNLAAQSLQKLADEGVLHTVARVGTFVGRPQSARGGLFVALFEGPTHSNIHCAALRAGFEDRIARLGGTSMVLDYQTAHRYLMNGEWVDPAGVFEFHYENETVWLRPGVPHVEFGELRPDRPHTDAVYFDNLDGGWQATRHLMALGHRRIAFVGLHGTQDEPRFFLWSLEREAGWRRALEEAGESVEGLSFRPARTPAVGDDQAAPAREVASQLLKRDDVTAIVVVNGNATQGLFEALREQGRSPDRWPAVVGFDTELLANPDHALHVVTALRLPWEEIGREAANLLWERSHGRQGEPQQRLVPMSLIARLSCRQEWHRAPGATSRRKHRVAAVA